MTDTIAAALDARAAGLVGRARERAVLLGTLEEGGPLVVYVQGLAGVGKSTLLRAFAADARAAGATVIGLDGGALEPTPRGFLTALAAATGGGLGSVEEAAERLARLGERTVLAVDAYERLWLLDDWVRERFVPALRTSTRVVLASRQPPAVAWPSSYGDLFLGVPLANLEAEDAEELLRRSGVSTADAVRLNRLARGHPLALQLSAGALAARPDVDLEAAAARTVVEELTPLYLDGLDPQTTRALEAASVVRRPTLPLLAAMLRDQAPHDAFERLRALPFVESDADGLAVHETVREAVRASLTAADPAAYRAYRAAAWRELRADLERASARDLWRCTADALYVLENPSIREAFFPTTEHRYAMERARPEDGPAILETIRRHEPPAAVPALEVWWEQLPGCFRVARDRSAQTAAVLAVTQIDRVPQRVVQADPILAAWREDLRRRPVAREQRVLAVRCLLTAAGGEAPSPAQAAAWLDIKRHYLELRPALRRVYTFVRALDVYGPVLERLGFEELSQGPVEVGGAHYHLLALDFGPASIDGWLARLVSQELQVDDDSLLDAAQRQLRVDGRRVDLSRLEFDLLQYLERHEGQVVGRAALLRDVWGTDYAGGSNVVEAIVSSLRRKLGDHAACIETVRGVGYRFRSPGAPG